jgi:GST-like protein
MSIVFYYAPMSSATPVTWALAELQVPHEKVKLDLTKGDQRKPEFLALNPNGQVPTLVADGTPMFEALAIMHWLGDRYGVQKKLWPASDDPARMQALAWTTWGYVSFASVVGRLFFASDHLGPQFKNDVQAAHCRQELDKLLSLLGERLGDRPYLLSNDFSLADLILASVVGWANMNQVPLDNQPRVRAWIERCQARPSAKASFGG